MLKRQLISVICQHYSPFHLQQVSNMRIGEERELDPGRLIKWFIKNSVSLIGRGRSEGLKAAVPLLSQPRLCAPPPSDYEIRSVREFIFIIKRGRAHQIGCHWFEYLLNSDSVAIIHLREVGSYCFLSWGVKNWKCQRSQIIPSQPRPVGSWHWGGWIYFNDAHSKC